MDLAASDPTAVVRLEQLGIQYEYPVTVTLRYETGQAADVLVSVVDRITEVRVPVKGRLAGVDINRDGLTILTVAKR
jgi:hypothetical protein